MSSEPSDIFYFCDESSFRGEEFMAVAGLAVDKLSIPIITKDLIGLKRGTYATGEIGWTNTQKREVQVRLDYIDHFWKLIQGKHAHFHIRFAQFSQYSHKDYERKEFDTTSRMYYQLLLHRAVRHYGGNNRLFIRPDDGDCTSELKNFKNGLQSEGYERYKTNPDCIDSIVCLNSEREPILQMLDVVLGAFTALRNARPLGDTKRKVAEHALKTLDKRDLKSNHDEGNRFSIWNVVPKKRGQKG